MILRGENTWIGDFDKDGNFIRVPNFPANYYRGGGSIIRSFTVAIGGGNRPVYEHRSGRLIRGTSADKPRSVFVPEIGSTVTAIAELDLKKPDRIVWNHNEAVAAFWTDERRKQFPRGLPKGTEPPKAGTPTGWEFIPFSKLDTDQFGRKLKQPKPLKQAWAIGDVVEFGYLSDEGEFIPDPDLPVVARSGIKGPMSNDLWSNPTYYTVPKLSRGLVTEEVYEYRSGRLIKGMLQKTGNFVPELGSKIMDFKDYDPIADRRRIYNLPGVLKRIEKK